MNRRPERQSNDSTRHDYCFMMSFLCFTLFGITMMASSRKSGKKMRQATLLMDHNQFKNRIKLPSRKRPVACIEILEDKDANEENGTVASARKSNDTPQEASLVVVEETLGPMPHNVFINMWKQVEQDDGWETADFEATNAFKKANNETDKNDTTVQKKAQYGRLSFQATRVLFTQVASLKYFHLFLDIGHGVGNTVLQAAYTVGCESLGIELVNLRAERADVYADKCREYNTLIHQQRDGKHYSVGPVRMRHGSLHAPEHRTFLTQSVDVALVNNFGDVFGHRCVDKPGQLTMDDHLSALFGQTKPGAVFLTLHPLPLPPCVEEANMIRKRVGLQESQHASFYTVEEYLLSGRNLLSWTNKPFVVYKYTRTSLQEAVFLCCNPTCEKARSMQTIPACFVNDQNVLCLNHCDCRVSERTSRNAQTYQCPRFEIHVEDE